MAKAKTDEKPAEKKVNIGSIAREAILAGKSNKEALEDVKAKFPDCNTTLNSINWYRNDLRKKGHKVPSPPRVAAPAKTAKDDDLTS